MQNYLQGKYFPQKCSPGEAAGGPVQLENPAGPPFSAEKGGETMKYI